MNRRFAAPLLFVVLIAFATGCGGPTPKERFEAFLANVQPSLGNKVSYDIQQTDSVVSPYAATINYSVQSADLPEWVLGKTKQCDMDVTALFAFQETAWQFKGLRYTLVSFEAEGGIWEMVSPTDALKMKEDYRGESVDETTETFDAMKRTSPKIAEAQRRDFKLDELEKCREF